MSKRPVQRHEEVIHRACVQLLALYEAQGRLIFTHPANGACKTAAVAGVMKALGQRAGVPDLLIWFDNGIHIQIELKAGGNGLSTAQRSWHAAMARLGWKVYVCHSVDEVHLVVRNHLARPRHVEP